MRFYNSTFFSDEKEDRLKAEVTHDKTDNAYPFTLRISDNHCIVTPLLTIYCQDRQTILSLLDTLHSAVAKLFQEAGDAKY